MNPLSKSSKTRNNKATNDNKDNKTQKTRSKHIKKKIIRHIQQFDLYLKDIEKLRGLDNETVHKIIKGGFIYEFTTNISTIFGNFFKNPIVESSLKFLKNVAISIFEVLQSFFKFLKDIFVDIWNHKTNSKWFWIITTLVSVGLFDWISVGFFSTSGLGTLIAGYNTSIASFFTVNGGLQNFNMFYFIFNIVCFLVTNGISIFGDLISLIGIPTPFSGGDPGWLVSIVWTLIGSAGLIGWYEWERQNVLRPAAVPAAAHGGNVDSDVDSASLSDIPHSKIAEMEKEDPLKFAMAQFSGYIKTNEKGEYYFTEQADKSLNVLLKTSVSVIKENCKQEDCRDATPTDKMNAFQFVHIAYIHAMTRKNTEEKISGKKHSNSIPEVVKHLKKEDVEWLGEKYPEQLKSAKRLGLLVDDKLTKAACGVLKQSRVINGKKIVPSMKKPHSSKLSSSSSESS